MTLVHDLSQVVGPDCRLHTLSTPAADLLATTASGKRVVAARLIWPGGPACETAETAGWHAIAVEALIQSPTVDGDEPLAQRLESAGVSVTAGVSDTASYIDLRGPKWTIKSALRAVAEAAIAGRLDEKAVRAAQASVVHRLRQRLQHSRHLAIDHLRAAQTDPANWFGRPPEAAMESVRAAGLAPIRQLTAAMVLHRPGVLIAGDSDVDGYAECLGALPITARRAGEQTVELAELPPAFAEASAARPYLLWGLLAPVAGPEDHATLEVAMHILGGWAGSRWQTLFRETLGTTYGAIASTTSIAVGGRTYCLAHVGMAVAADAVATCRGLIARQAGEFVGEGPAPPELFQAAAQLLRGEAHFHDATRNLMARTASVIQAGLGPDFAAQRMAALRTVQPDRFLSRLRRLTQRTTLLTLTSAREGP